MIQLRGVSKRFGATLVLDQVDLDIRRGSFVALLGASGSGKTTLLRIVAGLEQADAGELRIDGRPALGLPPGKRGIGFVFQSYALFAHMTVEANIGFGLRVRRPRLGRGAIRAEVQRLLAMVRLQGLEARMPAQLSGGQRQRVALARALAVQPPILLLDEPFGALDRHIREELRHSLKRLHAQLGVTTVFVTHDQEEARSLADRVVILDRGRVAADLAVADLGEATGVAAQFLDV